MRSFLVVTELLRKLLVETSYDVQFRRDQWFDCLVSKGPERWRGRGDDDDDALQDAIGQMLPSALGRRLLAQALAGRSGVLVAAEERAPAGLAPEEIPAPLAPPAAEAEPPPAPIMAEAVRPAASTEAVDGAEPVSEPPVSPVAASAVVGRSLRIQAVAKTDRGPLREHNADACVAVPERGLVVVADGVGAGAGSAVAATVVVETARRAFEGDAPLSPVRRKGLPILIGAIQEANGQVFEEARRDPSLQGMRTSVAAALIIGRQAVLAHVGDCRIYRLRRGVLELLTTDHSSANRRLRASGPPSTRARPMRAVGAQRAVEVDSSVVTAQAGDVLLLCTVGLHGALPHEDLSDLIVQHQDPEAAVDQLLGRVRARGGTDDVTAAVVRWES